MVLRYSIVMLICLLFVQSCGVYSFTGASLSPDVKTLSISQFYNNALLGPNDMGQIFSENLREYFQRNSSLKTVPEEGDLQISGTIESFTLTPVAPTSAGNQNSPDYATLTRLSIQVLATYKNTKDPTFNFEDQSFTFFTDFEQDRVDITVREREFVEEIFDQIVLDIFNKSLANW